jgi:hypothetical protein
MTRKLGSAKTLLVKQRIKIHDSQAPENALELSETLRYASPETFRSDISSTHTKRIHVRAKGDVLTVIDGKISPAPDTWFDRYKYILLYHSRILLQDHLDRLGVDVTVSSLGRFQDRIAFVIGSEYPDESRPQVWVGKDTFIPFRWVLTGEDAYGPENRLEVRFLKWRLVDRAWYPMHIEFYQNAILKREIHVDSIEVNPLFSDNIFDIEQLKSTYPLEMTAPRDPIKREELNEVDQTIQEFKKIFD